LYNETAKTKDVARRRRLLRVNHHPHHHPHAANPAVRRRRAATHPRRHPLPHAAKRKSHRPRLQDAAKQQPFLYQNYTSPIFNINKLVDITIVIR